MQVKIIATPADQETSKKNNKIWTEDPGGTPKKRPIFSKSGSAIESWPIGSIQDIPVPCKVPKKVRKLLELHCYVQTIKYVDLAKYQYAYNLTNNKVQFGDFHALISDACTLW
jgi:hypothetical protein